MDDRDIKEKFIKYFDNDKSKFEKFCKIFLKWLKFEGNDFQVGADMNMIVWTGTSKSDNKGKYIIKN